MFVVERGGGGEGRYVRVGEDGGRDRESERKKKMEIEEVNYFLTFYSKFHCALPGYET